jgi:hypothetical protein
MLWEDYAWREQVEACSCNKNKKAVVIKTRRLYVHHCSISYCRSKKNTKTLLGASNEVGLEVKPERTKYMLMSRSQKTGQKHSIKIANRSFKEVGKFKYLGKTPTYQNCMHEEIKSGLSSMKACYRSVHSLLSSHLLSRNVKVKMHKTMILSIVLYGCESWSLTTRE